jgi:hypothetical protein
MQDVLGTDVAFRNVLASHAIGADCRTCTVIAFRAKRHFSRCRTRCVVFTPPMRHILDVVGAAPRLACLPAAVIGIDCLRRADVFAEVLAAEDWTGITGKVPPRSWAA